MLRNAWKVIKLDQNMSEFWWIVCKNIILTLVNLLVLKYELFVNASVGITLRWVNWWWWAPGYTVGFLEPTALININEVLSYVYTGQHVKYLLFLADFNETWIFWTDFLKFLKCQISWKSIQWELSCSTQTDGQTGRQTDRHRQTLRSL